MARKKKTGSFKLNTNCQKELGLYINNNRIKINRSSNFLCPCPETEEKRKFEGYNSFYNNWATRNHDKTTKIERGRMKNSMFIVSIRILIFDEASYHLLPKK